MAATISDVAKKAGVGIGTVSRVINNEAHVSERSKTAVMSAIEELNFVPNGMASRLRRQRSKIFALLVPVIYHPFFSKLAACIEQEADKYGYTVLLVASQDHVGKEKSVFKRITQREIDGAIVVTHYKHSLSEIKDCPIISIDRHLSESIPFVTSNNYESTESAVDYMIQKGCKKIGYIGSKPIVSSEVALREKAYSDVMKRYNRSSYMLNEVIIHGDEESLVERFFELYPDVDGIFVSGYSLAQSVLKIANLKNRKVPEDLQIVAYDGMFDPWEDNVKMTCVQQPIEEMARAAVDLLMQSINGKSVTVKNVFQSKFVVGDTTKK